MNLYGAEEDAKSSNDFEKAQEIWKEISFWLEMEFVCRDACKLERRLTPNDLLYFGAILYAECSVSSGSVSGFTVQSLHLELGR